MIDIEIAWADPKMGRTAAGESLALRTWGKDRWTVIKRRVASLAAAPTLADMRGVPGRFHQLTGDHAHQFALTINANERLVFESDHNPLPTLPDGGVDLAAVTRIRIIELVDYHA